MTDQISRTELCTHFALKTGTLGLFPNRLHRKGGLPEQIMILRKYQNVSGRLGHHCLLHRRLFGQLLSHHRSAHDQCEIRNGRMRCLYTLQHRGADRYAQLDGMLYLSDYGKIFLCDSLSFQSICNVQYRAHIVNYTSDIGWKPPLRYASACYLLNQCLLIACRIKISKLKDLHVAVLLTDRHLKCCDFFFICTL